MQEKLQQPTRNWVLVSYNWMLDCKFAFMNHFKELLERSAFGVCSYLGDKMGIASARVRLYFIYATFVTLGSPLIFYLVTAFWLNIRKYIRRHRSVLWE